MRCGRDGGREAGPLLCAGRAAAPGAFPGLCRAAAGKGRRARSERGGDSPGCPGAGPAVGSRRCVLQGAESTAGSRPCCPRACAAGRMRDAAGVLAELPLVAQGGCVGSSGTLGFSFRKRALAPPGSPRRLHPACLATGRALGAGTASSLLPLRSAYCGHHGSLYRASPRTKLCSAQAWCWPSSPARLALAKGEERPELLHPGKKSRIPRPCPLRGALAVNAPLHLAREVRRVHKENMCCELEGPT